MTSLRARVLTCIIGLVPIYMTASFAQTPESTCEVAFIDCVRGATTRYEDQRLAILDGYRPIGRDFPAMGEHWIRIGLVFDGEFNPARPEILTYLNVAGTPRLTGVAYALPLLAGEVPPPWPAGSGAWHDHFRTLTDETFLPEHHVRHGESARVAMLHAWFWPENPAGAFAADNWAIPYARLGLVPTNDVEAAKTLALLHGGVEFFRDALEATVALSEAEERAVVRALGRAADTAATLLKERSADEVRLTTAETERLATAWSDLWVDLDGLVSDVARNIVQNHPLR